MNNDGKIKIYNKDGKEKEYSMLATFEYNNKNFAIYTDHQTDDNNNIKIYASIYNPGVKDGKLEKITEPKDIKFIENYIKDLEDDLKSGMKF